MRLLRALVVLAGLLGITLLARADGFILPNPIVPLPPEQHLRPLEIEYHKVTIQVADGLAHFTVDQVFRNPHTFALEGTYFFPLPKDAVVEQFSLWDGEHKLTGEVLGKEKARRLYLDLVRRLKDPALLEYVERDLFKASLFPIPPKGERRIQLKYTQVLPVSGGLYKVDYPLDTERFSATPLDTVEIKLKLHTTQPLGAIYSPTHKVKVERLDATTAKVSW
jgi:Ca-activated chloride channel family protein